MFFNIDHCSKWLNGFKEKNIIKDNLTWFNNAQTKSSLTNYLRYKNEPKMEKYLLEKCSYHASN